MNVPGLVASLLNLYATLILIYVILGWFVMTNRGGALWDIHTALSAICEPYLGLFRRFVPPIMVGAGGLDLSPLIGLIVLQILAGVVAGLH